MQPSLQLRKLRLAEPNFLSFLFTSLIIVIHDSTKPSTASVPPASYLHNYSSQPSDLSSNDSSSSQNRSELQDILSHSPYSSFWTTSSKSSSGIMVELAISYPSPSLDESYFFNQIFSVLAIGDSQVNQTDFVPTFVASS